MHKLTFAHRATARAFLPVVLAAGAIACGSSSSSSSSSSSGGGTGSTAAPTPVTVDRSQPLSGENLALGVLGDPTLSGQTTYTTQDAEVHALNLDIIAEVDAENPGTLAADAADIHSQDAARVATGYASLNAILEQASTSSTIAARIHADPVFADITPGTSSDDSFNVSLHLDNGLVGGGDASLVSDAGMLVCDFANAPNLGQVNGRYGDSYTGASGAAHDLLDLPSGDPVSTALRARTLVNIDNGSTTPDPSSRLGAYAATSGNASGTVGASVHAAIGTIYLALGNYGQEEIGRVFNDPQAKALYKQPVASCTSRLIATIEHNYWANVAKEDPYSAGGQLGAAFNPWSRNLLQQYIFNHL